MPDCNEKMKTGSKVENLNTMMTKGSMNARHHKKSLFKKRLLGWACCLLIAPLLKGNGFSEPPALIYGKVVNFEVNRPPLPLFDGELSITIVNELDVNNVVVLETRLQPSGDEGVYSYSISVPQEYLPLTREKSKKLSIGTETGRYRIESITLDGYTATPLDRGQSLMDLGFAEKAVEHRLDLQVSVDQLDTDGDGLPDWWEDLYGLNAHFAGDASANEDGDDWDNLEELQRGGNPNENDEALTLVDADIWLPESGSAGVWLAVLDSDDAPSTILFSITGLPSGATLYRGSEASPSNFTYEDVLDGAIRLVAEGEFDNALIELSAVDGDGHTATGTLTIRSLDPASATAETPVAWLRSDNLEPNASGALSDNDPLSEWGESGLPIVFQPVAEFQPIYDDTNAVAHFSGDAYFYLNDTDLDFSNFTLLSSFTADTDSLEGTQSTLLHLESFELNIPGTDEPAYTGILRVSEDGRAIYGPVVTLGSDTQVSVTGNSSSTSLTVDGTQTFLSQTSDGVFTDGFATLGAQYRYADQTAADFFKGNFQEIILFDLELSPEERLRIEDYQLSRFSDALVWDYHGITDPVTIRGSDDQRNIISGGWNSDTLVGSANNDIIRGGASADILTGNEGADRFQFFVDSGNDVITDYSEADGDVIDISPIFQSVQGKPESYVRLRPKSVFVTGSAPMISTEVRVDLEGDGGDPDFVITLEGVRFDDTDLERMVISGAILLGGPTYLNEVSIEIETLEMYELEKDHLITLTRSGNLEASVDVYLSFTGTAGLLDDYTVDGDSSSTSVVKKVTFDSGQSEIPINIQPIQDTEDEFEAITIAILPSPHVSVSGDAVSTISLDDAPQLTITTIVDNAQRYKATPGIIQVTREGSLEEPLTLVLDFMGTATNGDDYALVSPALTFAAGEATSEIDITPLADRSGRGLAVTATVGVTERKDQFQLMGTGEASVLILEILGTGVKTFAQWATDSGLNFDDTNFATGDGDNDQIYNIFEYAFGLGNGTENGIEDVSLSTYTIDGFLELQIEVAAGLSDIEFNLLTSTDGINWSNAEALFDAYIEKPVEDRAMKRFRSKIPASKFSDVNLYSLNLNFHDE